MVSQELKDKVSAIVKKNIADANKFYSRTFDMPEIRYDLRGRTAGQALVQQWVIRINPILLLENEYEMVNETTPHEVAHLIDFKVNPVNFQRRDRGRRSLHGPTFKFILGHVLGCSNTSTTHRMDTTNAQVRKRPSVKYVWISKTDGSEMVLGPKRHKNMLNGTRRYWLRGHSNDTYEFSHIQGDNKHTSPQPTKPMPTFENNDIPDPINDPWIVLNPTEAMAAQDSTTSHNRPTLKPGGSKKQRAQVIFRSFATPDRKTFIKRCVNELDMTKNGASTYYHNFNTGKW